MHTIHIPPSVIERVVRLRGKEHVYDTLEPARTALVVVDLQNAFMMEGVAHSLCLAAPGIVPNINRLARAVRAGGGRVVWIQTTFHEDDWPVHYGMTGPEGKARRRVALGKGGLGHQLWAGLEVRDGDLMVEKTRYSAFIQGSSNLAELLRAHGIDTILVGGTVTNVCCESTARDAMMLDFKTVMVSDANAAHTDEEHNASLIAFYLAFGDVMATDTLVACLGRGQS